MEFGLEIWSLFSTENATIALTQWTSCENHSCKWICSEVACTSGFREIVALSNFLGLKFSFRHVDNPEVVLVSQL